MKKGSNCVINQMTLVLHGNLIYTYVTCVYIYFSFEAEKYDVGAGMLS